MDFEFMFNISLIVNVVLIVILFVTITHLKDLISANNQLVEEVEKLVANILKRKKDNDYKS